METKTKLKRQIIRSGILVYLSEFIGAFMFETGHNRKQFLVDRIAFFSDAIIAITMTMLILEFKVPALGKHKTRLQIKAEYGTTVLVLHAGFRISFISIGNLWIRHHELFEHVKDYNRRLIRRNLRFLQFVMLLPLSTSFMLQDDNPWFLHYFFFFCNLGFCNLTYYFLYQTIFNKKQPLSSLSSQEILKKQQPNILLMLFIFFGTALLSLVLEHYFYLLVYLLLLPFVQRLLLWIKKYKKIQDENNDSVKMTDRGFWYNNGRIRYRNIESARAMNDLNSLISLFKH